jgi:hypothetical protein
MGQKVERVRTNIPEAQMAKAIIDGWRSLFQTTPTKPQVAIILSQNALETGYRKNMWNYNVGNITTNGKGLNDYWEGLDWLYDYFTDTSGITQKQKKSIKLKYKAYPNLIEGVKDYLKTISSGRYSKAWQNILNPDPEAYSKELKKAGYYTADEESYTKGLVGRFRDFSKSKGYEMGKYLADENNTQPQQNQLTQQPQNSGMLSGFLSKIEKFLEGIFAGQLSEEKMKKYAGLPNNKFLITVDSKSKLEDKLEYVRVLSLALREELDAGIKVCCEKNQIEIECNVFGNEELASESVKEICYAISDEFLDATYKLGGIKINNLIIPGAKSGFKELEMKIAEINYRKFQLKMLGTKNG